MISLLLADDHIVVTEGIKLLLQDAHAIQCGTCRNYAWIDFEDEGVRVRKKSERQMAKGVQRTAKSKQPSKMKTYTFTNTC